MNVSPLSFPSPTFFSSRLWLGGFFVAGTIFTLLFSISRLPGMNDHALAELNHRGTGLRSIIADLRRYSPLDPVYLPWSDARDSALAHGLQWTVASDDTFRDVQMPMDGSSQYWKGVLSGDPASLFQTLKLMTGDQASPYRPIAIQITDKGASALVLVYGRLSS